MELTDYSDIFNTPLYDCYFIYMGDDNKEYPVIETLKAQRVFEESTFISREPILAGERIWHSRDKWQSIIKSYNKKYILIFADLKIQDYFFELRKICEKAGYPNDKIIIILANNYAYVSNELKDQYSAFTDTYDILDSLTMEENQILQKGLGKVFYRLSLMDYIPTIMTLCDELELEFEWKYVKQ